MFCAAQDIIGTNVLTMITSPPPCGHVFQQTGTIFELIQDIIKTNVLTKFHDDLTINVTFRVLTMLTRKNAPPLTAMYLNRPEPFLNSSKISFDQLFWPINVTWRVLASFDYSHIGKTALHPSGHFKIVQDIIGTNLLNFFMKSRQ
ncbi:hypothetical protein DPMN_107127 [Dreissena polymorpha]|uniref:Uncharacterized protein n=1 Tax=Dreissena polymorpha TaxID=45954 RepID=A0A9D4K699_DREPO|nr:hypothetical protein DPMN_107127 [Dreissena polymorpha]